MKKLSILLLTSLLVTSISSFANQHFYQQLCNYTQKPLLIIAKNGFGVHTNGLSGAKIAPNQCSTYRYVVHSHHDLGEDRFFEYIYLAPSLTLISSLHIYNKQWSHKKTRMNQIHTLPGYQVQLLDRRGRHYTIHVCDTTSTSQCT